MKKKLLSLLLAAVLLLAVLPGMAAAAPAAKPVSGDHFTETLTTAMAGVKFDTAFDMVFVEGGTFTLGWEAEDASLRPENVDPVRNVTVSDFYIGETEVTVSMWNAVMGLGQPGFDANRPKEQVSFYQVQEFLDRLYVLTGRTYRLATEAEWEFAAKGGNPGKTGSTDYPGNNHKYLFAGSNVHDAVVADTRGVQNVKTKKPNILGIYDLCGNAEEWTYNSWDANLVGGVDPIGPGGPFHQQKTRRGGTYGTASSDSTRTLVGRQVRSIDGGAAMGFRIALSGDMNSVPAGMVRPRDVAHPSIDERNLPVTYRDQRWVTGDSYVWAGNFANILYFTMKLWDTGEMIIQSPGFDDRVGQWYTVSNLGIVFVENAFEENEERITLPYMFLTEELATIINDVAFTGAGVPYGRFEKTADSTGIAKPTGLTLYDPEALAAASEHDHTSYDLSNITAEMQGKDERLIDGEGYGWWQTTNIGIHQYRKDITDSIFRFVVYSPAFGSGTGGADVGYGANYLAQGSWYTVNDMLLVIQAGNTTLHYLYTVTDGSNSSTRQLMHISYIDYEKGDQRCFELHPNEEIRGYTRDIPNSFFWPFGTSTFLAAPDAETLCPGGCGETIRHCRCATICPDCNEHVNHCVCIKTNPEITLVGGAAAAEEAFKSYTAENSVTQAHLDAFARLAIGCHHIHRSWSDFTKVNATVDRPGSVTATLTLTIADYGWTRTVPVSVTIPALPKADGAGRTLTPDSTVGGEKVTMTAAGMEESFTVFDIGSLFGMPGSFGYTYAMWFGADGTFSFDRDVTFTKSYFDAALTVQGSDSIPVKAGEVIRVADGVWSEYMGQTVTWSEFSITMDDGNSWMIIDSASPGNYAGFPADTPLSEFPGKLGRPISVTVGGKAVAWTDAVPFIDDNSRTLVPLRAVGDAMGLTVGWDASAREASFTDGTKTIYFPIGSRDARTGDGGTVSMDTAAVIKGGRTFAPIRALAEYFGYTVAWDASTRTVIIK